MVEISAARVKELRESTGAGMMDCKRALTEAGGDMERAVEILRKKGLAAARKKAGRATGEGLIEAYVHMTGKIGVLVEVNCETDFVARTEEFRNFAHDVALQIAASAPEYVSREDVPEEVLSEQRHILREQALTEGKPEHILQRIVDGRLDKFYSDVCLLEQPFIRDTDKTMGDLLREIIAAVGENISIRRFVRFVLGEGEK